MCVRDKIADFMYKNGTNPSNNVRTPAEYDEKILSPVKLEMVNMGIDFVKKLRFVRVKFLGSGKYYEYHFATKDEFKIWCKEIADIDLLSSISIFKEEEKLW